MNNDTKPRPFPSLVDDELKHPRQCVDKVFAGVWKGLNISRLIQYSGFKKRSGVPIIDSVFLLVLWKWIDVSSIAVFAKQSLRVLFERVISYLGIWALALSAPSLTFAYGSSTPAAQSLAKP